MADLALECPGSLMTSPENYDGYIKYGRDEAETYDETRTDEALWHFENAFVKDFFSRERPARILDAPVGTGRFLSFYPRESQIVGLDVSEHMLGRARSKLEELALPQAKLVQGDIFRLEFESGYFDCIVCWRLLHLLPDEKLVPALAELSRVLSGRLIVQIYLQGSFWRRLLSRTGRAIKRLLGRAQRVHPHRSSTHIRTYIHSRKFLEASIAAAGLQPCESRVLGHYYGHDVCVYVLERTK